MGAIFRTSSLQNSNTLQDFKMQIPSTKYDYASLNSLLTVSLIGKGLLNKKPCM